MTFENVKIDTFCRFYTQKRPIGKPVGLPKIGSFETNHPPCLNNINNNNQKTQQLQQQQHQQNNQDHHLTMNSDTNSNIEVPSTKHDPNATNQTHNLQQHQQQHQNQNLPLPPPPVDDNYAVTEL